eukprot:m.74652 g.74652  ORF g.74652 m.74652 type:complete len:722 (-) comp24684_c1_seq1:101-2266(-)
MGISMESNLPTVSMSNLNPPTVSMKTQHQQCNHTPKKAPSYNGGAKSNAKRSLPATPTAKKTDSFSSAADHDQTIPYSNGGATTVTIAPNSNIKNSPSTSKKTINPPAPGTPTRRRKLPPAQGGPAKIRSGAPKKLPVVGTDGRARLSPTKQLRVTRGKRTRPPPTKTQITLHDLTQEIWQKIANYLSPTDAAMVARAGNHRLRLMMHKIVHTHNGSEQPPVIDLKQPTIPIEDVGTVINTWVNLKFTYKCNHTTSGTYYSEQAKEFAQLSMLPHFGRLQSLTLNECDDVVDVSAIATVPNLVFNRCNGLRDLRPLAYVQSMEIAWCLNVSNVSVLTNVTTLIIDRCPKVSVLDGLGGGKLEHLILRKCRNIRDLSGLNGTKMKSLVLEQMHNVSDLSPLVGLEKLTVKECPQIKDIGAITCVPQVTFIRCRNIVDPQSYQSFANITIMEAGLGARPGTLASFTEQKALLRRRSSSSDSIATCDSSLQSQSHSHSQSTLSLNSGLSRSSSLCDNMDVFSVSESVSVNDLSLTSSLDDTSSGIATPTPLRVASNAEDWVAAAKNLKKDQHYQDMLKEQEQQKLQDKLQEMEAEARLEQADVMLALENEAFLAECEARANFDQAHIRARNLRRLTSENRKQQVEQAEAEARLASQVAVIERLAKLEVKTVQCAAQREQRKDRVAALMARVKAKNVDKTPVVASETVKVIREHNHIATLIQMSL